MNAVTAGLCPDINHRIARAGGSRPENPVTVGKADGHGIDQNIAVVGRIKIHFAANGGDADAIAVSTNARHHTAQQVTRFFVIRCAKPQRIQQGHRARAHGEYIAQNTADTGCRPLIGFNERGMIVAFDLENCRKAIADIHRASIFARPLDDLWSVHRQGFKPPL